MVFTFNIQQSPRFQKRGEKKEANNENTDGGERELFFGFVAGFFLGFGSFKSASSQVSIDGLRLVS